MEFFNLVMPNIFYYFAMARLIRLEIKTVSHLINIHDQCLLLIRTIYYRDLQYFRSQRHWNVFNWLAHQILRWNW